MACIRHWAKAPPHVYGAGSLQEELTVTTASPRKRQMSTKQLTLEEVIITVLTILYSARVEESKKHARGPSLFSMKIKQLSTWRKHIQRNKCNQLSSKHVEESPHSFCCSTEQCSQMTLAEVNIIRFKHEASWDWGQGAKLSWPSEALRKPQPSKKCRLKST